jgi:hypothetical protein
LSAAVRVGGVSRDGEALLSDDGRLTMIPNGGCHDRQPFFGICFLSRMAFSKILQRVARSQRTGDGESVVACDSGGRNGKGFAGVGGLALVAGGACGLTPSRTTGFGGDELPPFGSLP